MSYILMIISFIKNSVRHFAPMSLMMCVLFVYMERYVHLCRHSISIIHTYIGYILTLFWYGNEKCILLWRKLHCHTCSLNVKVKLLRRLLYWLSNLSIWHEQRVIWLRNLRIIIIIFPSKNLKFNFHCIFDDIWHFVCEWPNFQQKHMLKILLFKNKKINYIL